MTSYTRKLYAKDPAAAVAFHRQSQFEDARRDETLTAAVRTPAKPGSIEIAYGRHTTLRRFATPRKVEG